MSNALREAVLHGEAFYSSLRERVLATARAASLELNSYLEAPPFSVRWGELLAGVFTVWGSSTHY